MLDSSQERILILTAICLPDILNILLIILADLILFLTGQMHLNVRQMYTI